MALRIVCADADKKAAASLAGFLRKQRLPTIVESVSSSSQKAGAEKQIVVWSRELAKSSCKQVKDFPNSVLVLLDKTPVPHELSGLDAVNAQSVGQRENVAWRAVSQLVKKDVTLTYADVSIAGYALPETKAVELSPVSEETAIDLEAMASELEVPSIEEELDLPELDEDIIQETVEVAELGALDTPVLDSVELPDLEAPELEEAEIEALSKEHLPEIDELPEIEDLEPVAALAAEPDVEPLAVELAESELPEIEEISVPDFDSEEAVEAVHENDLSIESDLPEIEEILELPEVEDVISESETVAQTVVEEVSSDILPEEEIPVIETTSEEPTSEVKTELDEVPEFADLAAAQPMQKFASKQKPSLLPILFLIVVLGALGAGAGLLHPDSPFYGSLSTNSETVE